MKFRKSIIGVGLLLCGLQLYALQADVGAGTAAKSATFTIITFDAPNAATGPFEGTTPYSINPQGEITGFYVDLNFMEHAFLRHTDGTFTSFDAPNAPGGTYPVSIDPAGDIAGYFVDANFVSHGFLREPDGTFTSFDAPNAGTQPFEGGTFPTSINPAGEIIGSIFGADFVYHGFLRHRDGTFITIDVPGEFETFPTSINPAGAIVGTFIDATIFIPHGFQRARDGTFTTFDTPGDIGAVLSINPTGEIAGAFCDPVDCHGYLRARDGTLTTFDAPAVSGFCCTNTFSSGINPSGAITGYYFNLNFVMSDLDVHHGFLRTPDGKITTFDAPGAGTGRNQGTYPNSINPSGEITGVVRDSNFAAHGFLLTYKAR